MKNSKDDWITIGRFGRPHGVHGLLSVHSFTDPQTAIIDYLPWTVKTAKQRLNLGIKPVRVNDRLILVSIEGISDRDQASLYTNTEIEIPRSILPAPGEGEYYWHDLVGMRVINRDKEELGVVTEVIATGSNDVLVVEGEKRHLIPWLPDLFVDSTDRGENLIVVDWDKDF